MSGTIITVKNVSKRYRVGAAQPGYKNFREMIMEGITAPVKNFNKLRRLTEFKNGDETDVIWALKDVSFEVQQGEVLGIIGRNGAGKSTMLKILSRITEPTSGSVEIHGRVSSLLEVGTGFHPELTGRENIFLNGTILGMRKKEIERKFDEIVAFAEIEKFLDTPVKRYSSGMYVRLAFAVAAHLEPEVLLVDEVLAVGDVGFQKKCLGKIEDIAQGGRTVIFISHNMGAIRSLCHSAVWLDKGQAVQKGAVDDVVRDYEEEQIHQFKDTATFVKREPEDTIDKRFYFTSVEMLNGNGEHTNVFRYGDKLILIAEFGGEPVGEKFIAEYYLYGDFRQLISVGSSGVFHGIYFNRNVRKIKMEIGPLILTTGKYSVSLSTCGELGDAGQRTDTWEGACSFTVAECRPFLTTRDISSREGCSILQQSFSEYEDKKTRNSG